MLEDASYQKLLLELEEERANIERMIVWVRGKLQQQDSIEVGTAPVNLRPGYESPVRLFPRGLAPDAFFRMSFPDAIKKFLNMVKGPKTAKEITEALDHGGLTHQAKNLYATVYPTLLRMEEGGDVVRVNRNQWALAEWYPAGRKTGEKQPETANGE